jgi:hypothetical protein
MPPQQQQTPALDAPPQLSDIRPDWKERVATGFDKLAQRFTGEPTALEHEMQIRHQQRLDEARMYQQNAATYATALHIINTTGKNPETGEPATDADREKYQHLFDTSYGAYAKIAGVSKRAKDSLGRSKALVDQIIKSGPGAAGADVAGQPTPGASPTNSGSPGVPPPPQLDPQEEALALPAVRQDIAETQKIHNAGRESSAQLASREESAKRAGLQPGTRDFQEFVATGKFPTGSHLQAKMVETADGQTMPANYDPATGQYSDQQGRLLDVKREITSASLNAKRFTYIGPSGEPLIGQQVGNQFLDQEGKPLPPDTQVYQRGAVPTETLRQVITYDAQGNPQINTLETMRTPVAASGGGKASQPRIPTPPKGRDMAGQPLGMSSGMQSKQVQRVTSVREANTQLFGDPSNPDLRGLDSFASLADDPESKERLGKALRLTFDGLAEDEKQHGSLTALIQAYAGVPQALAAAKAQVQQSVLDDLTPEEQEAYDATISAFSSIVGLRSLTGASAAQFSVRALQQDVPVIGVTAKNSAQFKNKLSRAGEIAYNGSKTVSDSVMPKNEKEYYKKKLQDMNPHKSSRVEAPPTIHLSTDDEILSLGKELAEKPH